MAGLGALYLRTDAPVSGESLARMESALRLHGPLRQSRWQGGRFGLCHSRAGDFTPQDAAERQPTLRGERWAMVFSGLLYHRDELVEKLGLNPPDAARLPDADLAIRAWERWREDAPNHLNGTYALVVADRQESTLHAVRSPLSALPLYYFSDRERMVIASAPKAIFALGDIPREIDEQRIADSLVQNHEDKERSFYRDIRSLPLGSMLVAKGQRVAVRQWANFDDIEPLWLNSDDDYVEAAHEFLDRATASAMRSRELPAATLSSGLDSTTVAVAALDYMRGHPEWSDRKLNTYTAVPDPEWDGITDAKGTVGDESGPVRALAAMYPQLDPHFVDCAGQNFDTDLDQLTALSEAPVIAVKNLHWILGINREAKRAGANVLLTGVAGSTSITGYGRSVPAMQLRQGKFGDVRRSLQGINNGRSFLGNFASQALRPNLPRSIVDGIDRAKGRIGDAEWNAIAPLNPDYAGDMRVSERRFEMMRNAHLRGRTHPAEENRQLALRGIRDASQPIRAALESLTGVQSRDPLGDRKLFEFCLAIPPEQFFHNGRTRWLVRRMMRDRLPPEVLHAPKGRQAADWHVRLTRDLPYLEREVERLADDEEMRRRFDIPRIRKLFETWPDKTPISTADHPDFMLARLGLTRTLNTARFINWVKGKN